MKQLGKSVEGSFTGAVNAIKVYNTGLKAVGLTQNEFHEAIAETNPILDAYITKMEANGKKPTEWGFIWQTKKATIQTGFFTAGISLGTAALGAFARYAKGDAAQSVAKLTGGLVAIGGAITAVIGVIKLLKGTMSLTLGFGILSAGIAALTAGINAFQTASARMREAWQADIDKLEQFKQSSEELAEAYVNVSKYLDALRNGEDVGDDLNNAVSIRGSFRKQTSSVLYGYSFPPLYFIKTTGLYRSNLHDSTELVLSSPFISIKLRS